MIYQCSHLWLTSICPVLVMSFIHTHTYMHTHTRTHTVRSPGCVWLSFLASAISHPWEINRGSGIGTRANWALLSLFPHCCQECFVIAAPGSHTAGPGGAVLRSDRGPFGCHGEDVYVWLSDLAEPNSQRKASSQGRLYVVLVLVGLWL